MSKPVLDSFLAVYDQLVQLDPAELDTDLVALEHQPLALAEYILANYEFTPRLQNELILAGLIELSLRAQRGEPLGCEAECACGWRPLRQAA